MRPIRAGIAGMHRNARDPRVSPVERWDRHGDPYPRAKETLMPIIGFVSDSER